MCNCIKDVWPEAKYHQLYAEVVIGVYQESQRLDRDALYDLVLDLNYCPKCGEKVEENDR